MDCPPVASLATADQMEPSLDTLQALFDMPWETLERLGPAKRREQDLTLSKFTSHSQDLPPGPLLYAMLYCLHLH